MFLIRGITDKTMLLRDPKRLRIMQIRCYATRLRRHRYWH